MLIRRRQGFGDAALDSRTQAAIDQLWDRLAKAQAQLASPLNNSDNYVAVAALAIPLIGPSMSLTWKAASYYYGQDKKTLSSKETIALLESMRPTIAAWASERAGTQEWFNRGGQMARGINAAVDIGSDYSIFDSVVHTGSKAWNDAGTAADKTLQKLNPWNLPSWVKYVGIAAVGGIAILYLAPFLPRSRRNDR